MGIPTPNELIIFGIFSTLGWLVFKFFRNLYKTLVGKGGE